MGSSLKPVLANNYLAKCEKVIDDNLVKEVAIKLYVRHVDDTYY